MPPAAQRMLFVINVIAKFAASYEIMYVFKPAMWRQIMHSEQVLRRVA